MKTVVCHPGGTLELSDFKIPQIGPGEVLVRLLACGVCGTDVRKMLPGKLSKRTVLGHEVVGEVIRSRALRRFRPGERLATSHHVPCFQCHFCRHENFSMCPSFKSSAIDPGGFSEFLRIPKAHVESLAQKVPPHVSTEEALFMEPLACCLRAIKRSRIMPGDVVLVTGLGSVGLLFGVLLERMGVTALGLDPLPQRSNAATDFGFSKTFTRLDSASLREIQRSSQGRGLDAVIASAGTPRLFEDLKDSLRDGGQMCLFGGNDDHAVLAIPWNEIYHRELTLTSSYSPSPHDLKEAFSMICDGLLKEHPIPIKKYNLERTREAIQDLKSHTILKAVNTP